MSGRDFWRIPVPLRRPIRACRAIEEDDDDKKLESFSSGDRKFSPATLRAACLKKTCDFLMNGVWEEREENPFSCMPVTTVQELLCSLWPHKSLLSRACLVRSRPLLTSGRLEHVTLPRAEDEDDYATLLGMLSLGCRNLQTLSVNRENYRWERRNAETERVLEELLQSCAKLQHLHSCVYFDPSCLKNCRDLKTLRADFSREETQMFLRRITSDLLEALRSVKVINLWSDPITVSEERDWRRARRMILDKCPQLTSLGHLDSFVALKEIHDSDMRAFRAPRRFRLRRCFWDVTLIRLFEICALSCPLLEVLKMHVQHSGVLRFLKTLRNLTCLIIHFYEKEGDNGPDFYSLLVEIGPQLRHVSVSWGFHCKPLSVAVICGNCPNLRTLELKGPMTAGESVQPCASLLNLEHLSVKDPDQKTLFFLLSNCLNLKVLHLEYYNILDDGELQVILQKNTFAELEVALIYMMSLSMRGWRRFVQSAVKLTKCCFECVFGDNEEVMQCVKDLNPDVVCLSAVRFFGCEREYFPENYDFSADNKMF